VRAAWWREKQEEVVDRSRYKVAAQKWSLHAGFVAVHQKIVRLLGSARKPRLEARRAETGSGSAEKLRCRRTHGGIAGLASRGRSLWQERDRAMKRSAT
jgi:mevalonate pyrophosphate decarboxylase